MSIFQRSWKWIKSHVPGKGTGTTQSLSDILKWLIILLLIFIAGSLVAAPAIQLINFIIGKLMMVGKFNILIFIAIALAVALLKNWSRISFRSEKKSESTDKEKGAEEKDDETEVADKKSWQVTLREIVKSNGFIFLLLLLVIQIILRTYFNPIWLAIYEWDGYWWAMGLFTLLALLWPIIYQHKGPLVLAVVASLLLALGFKSGFEKQLEASPIINPKGKEPVSKPHDLWPEANAPVGCGEFHEVPFGYSFSAQAKDTMQTIQVVGYSKSGAIVVNGYSGPNLPPINIGRRVSTLRLCSMTDSKIPVNLRIYLP